MPPPEPQAALADSYKEICASYHSIDDFRTKLLGFLPLASGIGIFALVKDPAPTTGSGGEGNPLGHYVSYIGAFGFLITVGLSLFEAYGIAKCANLIQLGSRAEKDLGVAGQFNTRPDPLLGWIDEVLASGVIYSSVLAAWAFLFVGGVASSGGKFNWPVSAGAAMIVLLAGVIITIMYKICLASKYNPEKWGG